MLIPEEYSIVASGGSHPISLLCPSLEIKYYVKYFDGSMPLIWVGSKTQPSGIG